MMNAASDVDGSLDIYGASSLIKSFYMEQTK